MQDRLDPPLTFVRCRGGTGARSVTGMWRNLTGSLRQVLLGERGSGPLLWLAVTVPVFVFSEPPEEPALPLTWVKAAAVPLLGLAVAVARRHPVAAAAVPVGLSFAATPELYTGNFLIAQLLLTFLLGRRAPGMRTGLLFCGAICLIGIALAVVTLADPWSGAFDVLSSVLFTVLPPWLAGRYARQHDRLVRTGWELAQRLERERDLTAERMRLLERARIAGDMHDSLGHELSLIALRAAALEVHPGVADSARKAASEVRESAADATDRLREIIGLLRQDGAVDASGDTIAALVERAAASGMSVTLDGELPPLPPMAERAAYRLVQEALTNAAKHAPGAAVTVRLGRDATGGAEVGVVNGPPPAGPLPGAASGGYGLVGLDERIRLAGGHLKAGPENGGFAVTASLPLDAPAGAHAAAPPASQQQLAQARRNVQRSMLDAIWLPAAVAAGLVAFVYGHNLYTSYASVLDADVYNALRIGESQATVRSRLPEIQADDGMLQGDDNGRPRGAPPDPSGADECRFYRTTIRSLSPAYRLCFSDGTLTHKDKVEITRQ
jgi:signal transduction histidine kinase